MSERRPDPLSIDKMHELTEKLAGDIIFGRGQFDRTDDDRLGAVIPIGELAREQAARDTKSILIRGRAPGTDDRLDALGQEMCAMLANEAPAVPKPTTLLNAPNRHAIDAPTVVEQGRKLELSINAAAKPALEALPNLNLYQITSELLELMEAREDAEAEGDAEGVQAMSDCIDRYVVAEAQKVKSLVSADKAIARTIGEIEQEIDRLGDWLKRWNGRRERLRASTLYALQVLEVKSLKVDTAQIRRQKNGGLAPVDILDRDVIPYDLQDYTVRLTAKQRNTILEVLRNYATLVDRTIPGVGVVPYVQEMETLARAIEAIPGTVNSTALRAALAKGEVPGAKLGDRGEHVRFE